MMAGCAAENSRIKSYCIKWLSFIVLKTLSKDETSIFRNLEKLEIRIIKLISHLDFNQTCYIYIYIYIYTHTHTHTHTHTRAHTRTQTAVYIDNSH